MNKAELITAMAEKSGLTKKDSELALNAFTSVVTEQLQKKEKVQLVGFGSFETVEREERTGRNPQNQEPLVIKAATVPKFRAGKALKTIVNQ